MAKVTMLLGGVSILCVVVSIILFIKSYQSETPITFSSDMLTEATPSGIMVDIEGAVINPGVYEMPTGSRIEDAIRIAGGLRSDADSEKIALTLNRAAKVVDGGKIFIPSLSDLSTLGNLSDLVSVNNASQAQLESLPGIGPVSAAKIINGRPYQTLDELVTKKAISKSVFEKIKNDIVL